MRYLIVIFLSAVLYTCAFRGIGLRNKVYSGFRTILHEVPLELSGQLDPSKSWKVKFLFEGEEKEAVVCEDTSLLEMGEKLFRGAPSSCRNGVCTTCSARILSGRENIKLAVHGFGKDIIDQGYVCSCQCYAVGPGVEIKLGMADEVYEEQYGKYEKSYEMKYSKDKGEIKKGLF